MTVNEALRVLRARWRIALLCLLLGSVDLALAASPRRLRLGRELPARVRLGAAATSELFVTNTGTRTLRGVLGDA